MRRQKDELIGKAEAAHYLRGEVRALHAPQKSESLQNRPENLKKPQPALRRMLLDANDEYVSVMILILLVADEDH